MQKLSLLFGILFIGALVTVRNIAVILSKFYVAEGTFFKVSHTAFPNPFLTPCLWGTAAFVLVTVWVFFLFGMDDERRIRHLRYLSWFLLGCVLFAWSVFAKETYYFYHPVGMFPVGCSGDPVTNPFTTTCFFGASVFLLASLVSFFIRRSIPRGVSL